MTLIPRRIRSLLSFPSLFLLGSLPLMASSCGILGPDDDSPKAEAQVTRMLFLGSSYLDDHDVPSRVEGFAVEAGKEVFIHGRLYTGVGLDGFSRDTTAAALIRDGDWDFLILQGGAHGVAYPELSEYATYLALEDLRGKAMAASPDTKVIYMMPWAYEDGMTWLEGREETYEVMQLDILENAVVWAQELDLVLAPVGMAFYEILTSWDAPQHYLHISDWNHATYLGAYLTAATIYSTVFAEGVADVEYEWWVETGLARALRDVASATVMDSLALWRITP